MNLIELNFFKSVLDLFVTERNLVLITFDLEALKNNEQKVIQSVIRRILKVLTKVMVIFIFKKNLILFNIKFIIHMNRICL